jgi:hypothetical protein
VTDFDHDYPTFRPDDLIRHLEQKARDLEQKERDVQVWNDVLAANRARDEAATKAAFALVERQRTEVYFASRVDWFSRPRDARGPEPEPSIGLLGVAFVAFAALGVIASVAAWFDSNVGREYRGGLYAAVLLTTATAWLAHKIPRRRWHVTGMVGVHRYVFVARRPPPVGRYAWFAGEPYFVTNIFGDSIQVRPRGAAPIPSGRPRPSLHRDWWDYSA